MTTTSHVVKTLTEGLPHLITGGVPGERAGEERLTSRRLDLSGARPLQLTSTAFGTDAPIPEKYSADGEGVSPPLAWSQVPAEARSLVLLVEDPEAPTVEPFVHWIVTGLPPRDGALGEGATGLTQGKNSLLKTGWAGCAPPRGDHPHHYHFQLFALDTDPALKPGVGRSELIDALQGHVVGYGQHVGTYAR